MKHMINKITKLSDLKKGDYFRFANQSTVHIYNGKARLYSQKTLKFKGWGYEYYNANDISSFHSTLQNREVKTNFIY